MLQRCTNRSHASFKSHGGRGIKIDPAWMNYAAFHNDMGSRPRGRTLDRINVNGNYCRSNCRWATPAEQRDNRRDTKRFAYNGVWRTEREWAAYLTERTQRKWSLKALRVILGFITIEQLMGSLHHCRRTPLELIGEAARRDAIEERNHAPQMQMLQPRVPAPVAAPA